MTIKQVIEEALNLADESDNESEYREKIIRAINHVQAKISKFAKQILKYANLTTKEKEITLPSDFLALISVEDSNGNYITYKQTDRNKIIVGNDGTYRVCYSKLLEDFPKDVGDDEEVQIENIAKECLIYGVAAEISIDNEDIYPILQNEYNNLLANLELAVDIPNSGSSISHIGGVWY